MGVSCCNTAGDNAVDSSDPQPLRGRRVTYTFGIQLLQQLA